MRSVTRLVLVCGILLFSVGSGLAEPTAADTISCDLPTSPDPIYAFEMGYARLGSSDAFEQARRDAEARFERRFCGGRFDCAALRAKMKPGGQGRNNSQICYRVVALRSDIDAVLARVTSIAPLEVGLETAARELLAELERLKVKERAVVVGDITDRGARGGDRGAWAHHIIERAVAKGGLTVQKAKRDKKGKLIVRNAVAITADLSDRIDHGMQVFEARLTAELSNGVRLPLSPAMCGLDAVVSTGVASPVGTLGERRERLDDPGIELMIETGPDGQICEGDTTQIHVSTAKPMHVRVFDLFGQDGMAIFPNPFFTDDQVRPGTPQPLGGPSGFQMVMSPGIDHERYIVIAAEKLEDLGPWARFTDYCRLRPEHVAALIDTPRAGFGRAAVKDVSFRMKRKGCKRQLTDAQRKEALSQLPPYCPL